MRGEKTKEDGEQLAVFATESNRTRNAYKHLEKSCHPDLSLVTANRASAKLNASREQAIGPPSANS